MTALTSTVLAATAGLPLTSWWRLISNPQCPAPATIDPAGVNTTWASSPSATVAISIAAPGVVSWTAHGQPIGTPVVFSTTGALPTGLTAGTTYYISKTGYGASSFELAATQAAALAGTGSITTSGSQSGVQTCAAPPILAFVANLLAARALGWLLPASILGTANLAAMASAAPGPFYGINPAGTDRLWDDYP